MKAVRLNKVELEVYKACINACKNGDNGYEFILDDVKCDIKKNSLKGYLSQLVQKELIQKFEDCYFDFGVVSKTPDYLKIKSFNYDFNIEIE